MQTAHKAWDDTLAAALIAAGGEGAGQSALLPLLHALQERFGYIDDAAIPLLADALNVSRADVHGVVSFYHDFRRAPPGRRVLRLCRAEACQALGCEALVDRLFAVHGLAMGDTTADGRLTVEEVYCLGNCALSPAAMLDARPLGRLNDAQLDRIVHGEETWGGPWEAPP